MKAPKNKGNDNPPDGNNRLDRSSTHPATLHPESSMMSLGYDPQTAMGAVKAPLYATSTFVFPDAESGKARFAAAHGEESGEPGPIYARLGHPGLELAEQRLAIWDQAEDCALFHSGMSAISTAMLAYLCPGDAVLFSGPLYGGSDHLIRHTLAGFQIQSLELQPDESDEQWKKRITRSGLKDKIRMVFIETPANPTMDLMSIRRCRRLTEWLKTPGAGRPLLMVDNTFLGPIWQKPLQHGADLVVYSATKYIGGHSDLIAGAVLGSREVMTPVRQLRVYLGTAAGPWVSWLLLRSLETLSVRLERQAQSAETVAHYLSRQDMVQSVQYLGFLEPVHGRKYETYKEQCLGPGAMISVYLNGGEPEAFRFLNSLRLIRLAVSLGGTESLAEHPATMTHSGMAPEDRERLGIHSNLIRLSIGLEHPEDIILDLERGFHALQQPIPVTAGISAGGQSGLRR